MHMRADRTGDVVTRRWAGWPASSPDWSESGISGLLAWLVAPLGSPVIAVGELIIEVLPAPLVNFGKETLGYADKPILLVMVVVAVLLLCGLAGRLELRPPLRRGGGIRPDRRPRPDRGQRATRASRPPRTCRPSSGCCSAT